MKKQYLILLFVFKAVFLSSQEAGEKAAKNFEKYFFSSLTPAEKDRILLRNYSDLWLRKSIPDELKLMMQYNPSTFYTSYLEYLRSSPDTLIKIETLDLSKIVIDTYLAFKKSVLDGQKLGKFDHKADKAYSQKLKQHVDQLNPPGIGCYQSVVFVKQGPDGKTETGKFVITYTNEFEIIGYEIIQN